MRPETTTIRGSLLVLAVLLAAPSARAAVPGITGTSFNLVATADFVSQPDGASIYAWGYGCDPASTPSFAPFPGACPLMQMPGPTLIVREGQPITVTLKNGLPPAAGNTSLVFPGFQVATTGGVAGLMAQEAASGGGGVTYAFTATRPGTFAYYSGSQPELQIEMGLFGALVVLPSAAPAGCTQGAYSLAASAYDHPDTCYDREYMFQISEIDSRIHERALAQVQACAAAPCPKISAVVEPYRPNYYLLNGRSMPDDMDTSYAPGYVHQPYNANPHMHPGERVLMRMIGQGRWQHPFHFHGNHARVLARDGNLLLSAVDGVSLAGPLLFTTPTVSGQTQDQIFSWSGKGLNWDVYNHRAGDGSKCTPDASGFHSVKTDPNYGEWCADHRKPIPVTPPDPTIVALGQWYAGTPYLGLQTTGAFTNTNEPPGTLNQNPQAGYAYMWHSHNEREITTNDVFPGGIMSMLLIDPPTWQIDETL
ncbi:MAG TPA: multicopper oxidase domain-containing protein [Myxococcales bacterium]|jgi:FtsP/CotA-like multicopper oxidase with cupredoxin domain